MPESSAFSDQAEDEIIEVLLRGQAAGAFASGTNRWIALVTAAVNEASDGADILEVAEASGYERGTVTFDAAAAGVTSNSAAVLFTASGGNWGTIVGIAIMDTAADATGGVIMFDNSMTDVVINDGDSLTFNPGDIDITVL